MKKKYWAALFICGLLYILSPIDLVPDYITGAGQADDFAVACLVILSFFKM